MQFISTYVILDIDIDTFRNQSIDYCNILDFWAVMKWGLSML